VLKIVENLWAVGAPLRTQLGELTALPRPRSGWGGACCPSSSTSAPPLSVFGFDFRPFGHTANEISWARIGCRHCSWTFSLCSNQINSINIRRQIIKSTQVKKKQMNNVRILKGEVGRSWHLPTLTFRFGKNF